MNNILALEIKNIRAIKEANIKINGITILTGENGCGKSTITKLAYYLTKISIEYEKIVDKKIENFLEDNGRKLVKFQREITDYFPIDDIIEVIKIDMGMVSFGFTFSTERINLMINSYITTFKKAKKPIEFQLSRIENLLRHAFDLEIQENKNIVSPDDIISLLEKIKDKIQKEFNEYENLKKTRNDFFLEGELRIPFYDNPIPNSFNIKEYDVPRIDRKNKKILPITSVNKILYIDTPVIVGFGGNFSGARKYWEDLNDILYRKKKIDEINLLSRKPLKKEKNHIKDILEKDIIKGNVKVTGPSILDENLIYNREDGGVFKLLESATGLKSFAIIQRLYDINFLDKETFLVIDEPEAHLHPQWIVEYARLIVLLNKYFKVKFLIASHHPDFISAIKNISEKEKNTDAVNFYLAEKEENTYQYNYRALGLDIEDIFGSFNIALARIDIYSDID